MRLPDFPQRTALTKRELQVTDLLVHGFSNKEAARALFISPRTVEYYREEIFKKLGVTSAVHLTRHVYQVQ